MNWTHRSSVTEYETGWYEGGYDLVEQPDGTSKRYYWAALAPAVIVVGIYDDQVVCVEQYRPTVKETQLELPAGIIEPGEDPIEAGHRELVEETGFRAATVTELQQMDVATGVLRHSRVHVVAEGLEPGERDLDENEFLSVETVPVGEAIDRARTPPTNDATIEGLLLAEREGYLAG